jgi:NDP-sugar pyrophosphorylase family protein
MKVDVLISTAGQGSRLHKISNKINKSLLPYSNKPIIHHIIEKIPMDLRIGILLGYNSEQVKDYLSIAFSEQNLIYIYVDDWLSSQSGTKHSLMCAQNLLHETFWYFPCDGIYKNVDFMYQEFKEDVFVVNKVNRNKALHYLTFDIKSDRIAKQFFKSTTNAGNYAFTGAMKIKNKEKFFSKLDESKSTEFISVISNESLVYVTESWRDLGNFEMYKEALSENGDFDFSKVDEFTYQLPNKIIKWWADPKIPTLKTEKPNLKPNVFPRNVKSRNQFLFYDKSSGSPFYEQVNKDNFGILLSWLKQELWLPIDLDIKKNLKEFYKNKTDARIELLGDKIESHSYNPKIINEVKVKSWHYYYKKIDWNLLIQDSKPSFIHGDLQFDNIIYEEATKKFSLIDWRYDFSGLKFLGDIHYDFAKMLGGIYINYQEIKKGNFEFNYKNGIVEIRTPPLKDHKKLMAMLEDCAKELELNFEKIKALVPLIFWNMAPLHQEPFSNLCWCLGIMNYEILDK